MLPLQRVTIQDKLKYLDRELNKLCIPHKKDSKFFCFKFSCSKCPYICQRCKRDQMHGHSDEIYDFQQFITKMCEKLQEIKSKQVGFSRGNVGQINRTEIEANYAQLMKTIEEMDLLQGKIMSIIEESKSRVRRELDKLHNVLQSKPSPKLHLYSNPNILINKLNSESSPQFLLELKRYLLQGSQNFNKNEIINGRAQTIALMSKIRQVAGGNGNASTGGITFVRGIPKVPSFSIAYLCNVTVEGEIQRMFSNRSHIALCTKNDTFLINLPSKKTENTFSSFSPLQISFLPTSSTFLAISRDPRQLVSHMNSKLTRHPPFDFKVASLCLIDRNFKNYGILGQDDGRISVFDVQKQKITFNHQSRSGQITYVLWYFRNNKILCCTSNGVINFYKYNAYDQELSLQVNEQIDLKIPQVSKCILTQTTLIFFSANRNLTIYDLMMKCQLYKTNFKERSPIFKSATAIEKENHLMITTHNEGEGFLYAWVVQNQKTDFLNADKKMLFEKNQEVPLAEITGEEVWAYRKADRIIYVYTMIVN